MFFINQWCFAQWKEDELKPYKQKAENEIKSYTDKMIKSGKWDKKYDALEIEFITDTMRIERTASLIDNERYSTADMHNTLSFRMTEYDKLLNKYYKLLMNKLSDEDKTKFREAQRVWLKYRDSEEKINSEIIAPNRYTGGGTMWPLVARGRTLEIIKERVCNFYEFIKYI
ncbi:MAG: lysozyme inhibitor LprI family protein [Bacteroidetes bacterium]|nr:lysozyme inhibitor LprI family protein [Bacteroidota bacterium]